MTEAFTDTLYSPAKRTVPCSCDRILRERCKTLYAGVRKLRALCVSVIHVFAEHSFRENPRKYACLKRSEIDSNSPCGRFTASQQSMNNCGVHRTLNHAQIIHTRRACSNATNHEVFEYHIWFPFLAGLAGYNILDDIIKTTCLPPFASSATKKCTHCLKSIS